MSKLEDKIKALLETKVVSEEDAILESVELEEAKVKVEKDGDVEVDTEKKDDTEDEDKGESEDKDEDDSDDEETEVAKDKAKVTEGTDPFGALDSAGSDEGGSVKTSKVTAGASKKDTSGKLVDGVKADAQDDAGDNAKIQKGASQKDTAGKLSGPALAEHMNAIFAGEELSEEFKAKTLTIFEAAVAATAAEQIEQLEEEYQRRLDEQAETLTAAINEAVEEVQSKLVEDIDGFLNYMVEQWIEENKVALERGMKLEMMDSFIDGLKTLFAEHYVDMPEEKLDVVEIQAQEIDELAEMVEALSDQNDVILEELVSLKKDAILEDVAEDMTKVEQDKFSSICEAIEFTTEDEFKQKVITIKESYFPKDRETVVTETAKVDESMTKYVSALTQNIRF